MRKMAIILIQILFMLTFLMPLAFAEVGITVQKTLNIDISPLDVAISPKGRYIFVLTEQKDLVVYMPNGEVKDSVRLNGSVDSIKPGPTDDMLILASKKDRNIQVVTLDFIENFDFAGSPFKGPAEAPVVVCVFSDFQCGACASLAPVLDKLIEKYPKDVKLIFKNYPLQSHRYSKQAAAAALAADTLGKFWSYHDLLFKNYNRMNSDTIREINQELGIDPEALEKEMSNPEILAMINRDLAEGSKAAIRGTPTVFINGRLVRGPSLQQMQKIIQNELGKLNVR